MTRIPTGRNLLFAVLLLAGSSPAGAQSVMQPAQVPEEMKQLDFLVGHWMGEGEVLDAEGNVVQRISWEEVGAEPMEIQPILGGLVLESGAGSEMARTWYTYRPLEKEFVWVAVDRQGHFDHLRGTFEDGKLVLTEIGPHPWPDGGTMMYRRTYQKIRDDSHEVLLEISRDEGETWTLFSRQRHHRAEGADGPAAAE